MKYILWVMTLSAVLAFLLAGCQTNTDVVENAMHIFPAETETVLPESTQTSESLQVKNDQSVYESQKPLTHNIQQYGRVAAVSLGMTYEDVIDLFTDADLC